MTIGAILKDERRVDLGPFTVRLDGTLGVRPGEAPPTFAFRWRDRVLEARLAAPAAAAGEDPHITIEAILGRVPSSTDPAGPAKRQEGLELVERLRASLPEGWHIRLLADHRLAMSTGTAPTRPMTASTLLADVIRQLLDLAPYLDLLEEAGLGVDGTAKT